MKRELPRTDQRAVIGGVAVDLLLIGVAAVPARMDPSLANVLGVFFIGLIGGGVAGRLTRDGERAGIWHGFLAGSIGGLVFGGVLVYTFLANVTGGFSGPSTTGSSPPSRSRRNSS